MNSLLKEFYSEDASRKSQSEADQIQSFKNWCDKRDLSYELTFEDSAPSFIRAIYYILAIAFVITFLFKALSDFRGYIFPVAMIFWFLNMRRSPKIVSV